MAPFGCNTAYQGDKKSLPSKSSPLRPVILPTLFRGRGEREREGGRSVCNAAHNQMLDNVSSFRGSVAFVSIMAKNIYFMRWLGSLWRCVALLVRSCSVTRRTLGCLCAAGVVARVF